MNPNPILRRLGLADTDRAVIFHADDIGMCQGTVTAFTHMLTFGVLSSAAVMTPCPWYPAAAQAIRSHSEHPRLDIGLHVTLNSEWTTYRWGPLSTRDQTSGLLDEAGYLHHRAWGTWEQARPEAVEAEAMAQIERALADGIALTHLDTHMLTLFHPRFLPIYIRLGLEYRLPIFLMRDVMRGGQRAFYPVEHNSGQAQLLARQIAALEEQGLPLFDHLHVMPLDNHHDRLGQALAALAELPPGLTNFLFHPSTDNAELRAIAPDWRCRTADYELFVDERWQRAVANSGVHVIGFRVLRDLMRAQ